MNSKNSEERGKFRSTTSVVGIFLTTFVLILTTTLFYNKNNDFFSSTDKENIAQNSESSDTIVVENSTKAVDSEPIAVTIVESVEQDNNGGREELTSPGFPIMNSDIENKRTIIDKFHEKDSEHVYYEGSIVEEADPASFVSLGYFYAKDKNQVFYQSYDENNNCGPTEDCVGRTIKIPLEDADPVSFELFYTATNSVYAIDKNHAYYFVKIIKGADPNTFEIIDHDYTSDRNNVFYRHEMLDGADPDSFEVVAYGDIAKDRSAVYERKYRLKGVDPNELVVLSWNYIRDDQNLYKIGHSDGPRQAVVDSLVDLDSFYIFSGLTYALDKGNVYLRVDDNYERYVAPGKLAIYFPGFAHYDSWKIIQGADAKTFEVVDYLGYAIDKDNLYYNGIELPGADPSTFEIVHSIGYAKDKSQVYLRDKIIFGADPATFEIVDLSGRNRLTKDKDREYDLDKPKETD